MKVKASHLLSLSALLLVLLSPAANAMIVRAHSPVTLLVTDPTGTHMIGCLDGSCTSDGSAKFVNSIPASEGATYAFCPTPTSTDCPTVTVTNPVAGTWTVQYFSTLTGDEVGHVYIDVQTCTNSPTCPTLDIVGTATNPVTITQGSTGSGTFYLKPTGTLAVPEFPLGLMLVVGLLAPALIVLGRVQLGRRKED